MKLPDRIDITISAGGRPISGVLVTIQIMTTYKNDFFSMFGPSDSEGRIQVPKEDLLREAEEERRLFLMDYGHPESDFKGEIVVAAVNREAIQKALATFKTFGSVSSYDPEHEPRLQSAHARLEELSPIRLDTRAALFGTEETVKVHSVSVEA